MDQGGRKAQHKFRTNSRHTGTVATLSPTYPDVAGLRDHLPNTGFDFYRRGSPPTSAPFGEDAAAERAKTEISDAPATRLTKPSITPRASAAIGPLETINRTQDEQSESCHELRIAPL